MLEILYLSFDFSNDVFSEDEEKELFLKSRHRRLPEREDISVFPLGH
jgi:hypothetical protein